MEEYQAGGTSMISSSSKSNVSAIDRGDEAVAQSGRNRMISEDLGHQNEGPKWETSPERTSLLPPFGAGQPAHLPTPQSPGDLVNYLSGPAGSPEGPRSAHIRRLSPHRPPSPHTSAHSTQTPQRGRLPLASKRPPLFSSRESKDLSRAGELEPTRLPPSQVATPSPEISRTRRASVPSTASDAEIMLETPKPRRRSSSHTWVPTSLAPAPMISPANSSNSTMYHASPEFEQDESQPRRRYHFSRGMAALVSEHDVQAGVRDQGYDLDDPFIVRDDEGRGEALSRRYPSPPPKHLRQFSALANTSPFQNATEQKGSFVTSIGNFVMSPSESSETPSYGSPVKIEVDDRPFDIPIEDSGTHIVYGGTPFRSPRVGSGGASVSEPHTTILENPVLQAPQHASGGEIERIRQRQATLKETRLAESEKRRPDYLTRIKRARETGDEEAAETERESSLPGLGVTISPFRGRRLKLYQPVAITGGVILEEPAIETDEATEPKTPPPISTVSTGSVPSWQSTVPSISLRAIDWHTPRGPSSPVAWTEENERRKQKRLMAFAAQAPSSKGRRLIPVEVVGQGRVIIDVTSEESRKLAEAGVLQLFETPETNSVEKAKLSLSTGRGAEWPDEEYPWSVQERQREEYEEAWRRQRLTRIERFLDRESESEDEENVAGPSTWNQHFDSGSITRPQKGHGKSISMNTAPNSKRSRGARQMTFNAANTDAREVLLSKKHVRTVAERLRKRKIAEEEEGVVMCICQGADDGRPMVRCDECRTWYHLICMDIHDESELGDEWYCWKCLPSAEDPSPAPPSEPTFAPAMPDSPPRAGVGDQPLYQSALQPSPMPASPIARRQRDRSPARRSRLLHSLADSGDPVRGGPSTPYQGRFADSRLYSTPKLYDEYRTDDHAPFDPTSTPSRGLKFPNPVPITPRRQHPWTPAPSLSWITPGPPLTPQFFSQSGSSSGRSLAHSLSTFEDSVGPLTSPWPADDTPTRKPHRGTDPTLPYPLSRRVLDSPLVVQGTDRRPFPLGVDGSPTPRHFHRLKDTDLELASRVGHWPHPD